MIFPLAAAALQIVLDGVPVVSYRRPYIERGRVMVPVDPYLTMASDSIEIDRGSVLVRRGDRFSQARMYDGYVPIAPLLRSLGAVVAYDARQRRVSISLPRVPFSTPTPFNPAVPQAPPVAIFTPVPKETPKAVVTGRPAPRRTPLPVTPPGPTPPAVPPR